MRNKLEDCNAFAGAPLSPDRVESAFSAAVDVWRLGSTRDLTAALQP